MVTIKQFKNGNARMYMSTYKGLELVGRYDSLEAALAAARVRGFTVDRLESAD